MPAVSVLDNVIGALVTLFQTAVGTSVPVYDGLPGTQVTDFDLVVVGDDGDPGNADNPAGTTTQERINPYRGTETEFGDVTCAVICQTGDDDLPGRRARSQVLMLALETALRADRTLGGVVIRSNIDTVALFQTRTGGSGVRRVFTVHYDA